MKITTANTFLVAVRMIFSLITQKVLAIIIGAEGIAIVGNFKNVINFFEQFCILGTFNGVVKYVSEFKGNKAKLNRLFSTAFGFAVVSAIISFVVLFFWSNSLNQYIFGLDKDYAFVFKILAFIIPFMGVNAVLTAFLNGFSAYKAYTRIMIATVVISTSLIVILTFNNNVEGALIAICITPILQFLIFLTFYLKKFIKVFSFNISSINFDFKRKLLSYSFMTLVVVLLINLVDVLIRNLIDESISAKEAGYWTAMTSVSRIYMQFTVALFPLYILPRYSDIKLTVDFRKEVINLYKSIVPLFIGGIVVIYVIRDFIIQILYTSDFLQMSSLFKWQLLGDLVKLCAIILSYQFLAKKRITYFVITEVLSVLLFYGFAKYFITSFGTEGVVLAHFVRYLLYFLIVAFILRNKLTGKDKIL